MIMRNARAGPRGTVMFMNNGKLYTARAGLLVRRQLHGRVSDRL